MRVRPDRTGKLASLMKATVEPVEGNKVKVSVQIDGDEFEPEVDAAFKRIAREVRIPGFRPGKAPRKLLEARIGIEAARGEALEHAVPRYYAEVVRDHEIDVIAQPDLEITGGESEGDVSFDAVVEVRPVVQVGGYDSLRVTIDSPDVTDEEVQERIDQLRGNFAELEEVDRPVEAGDLVTIDVVGTRDGEPQEGLTADDYLYEAGSGAVIAEWDEQLIGAEAGAELTFTADHPDPEDDGTVDFAITVKAVKERVLPDADDEFAAQASEFETLAELEEDLRTRMSAVKRSQARYQVEQKVGEALAELVDEDPPEALVNSEMQRRLEDTAMRLQAQGISLDQFFAITGQDQETWVAELRESSRIGVLVDLALRAVVAAEEIDVDDDDVDAEIETVAAQFGRKPAQVRTELERNGQMPAIRSDLRKRKALEWLIETVELVDGSGETIDRASLELEAPAADEPPSEADEAETEDDE